MKYNNIIEAEFLSRPNRFIAVCLVNGREETVHVKNTGRCRELLKKGAKVILNISDNPSRKTKYDLIAVYKGDMLVNMDSQSPNQVVEEWIKRGGIIKNPSFVKAEKVYGSSRLDFYIEGSGRKVFVEAKGVTLENNGVACFPDAPTQRGTKHLNELIKAVDEGYEAVAVFVIQMKGCGLFIPNDKTDKVFSDTLRKAAKHGVDIIAVDCMVAPDSINIDAKVKTELNMFDK